MLKTRLTGFIMLSLILICMNSISYAYITLDRKYDNLKGKVQFITEKIAEVKDVNGKLTENKSVISGNYIFDSLGNPITVYKYDTKGVLDHTILYAYALGKKTEMMILNRTYQFEQCIYYNDRGNIREEQNYDSLGKLSEKIIYTYNEQGQLTDELLITPDGQMTFVYVYNYDQNSNEIVKKFFHNKNGDCVEESLSDSKGRIISFKWGGSITEWTYHTNGKISRLKSSDEDFQSIFEFDERENLVAETIFDVNLNLTIKYRYQYDLDSQGNWIKQTKSVLIKKAGGDQYQVSSYTYRIITYYL